MSFIPPTINSVVIIPTFYLSACAALVVTVVVMVLIVVRLLPGTCIYCVLTGPNTRGSIENVLNYECTKLG